MNGCSALRSKLRSRTTDELGAAWNGGDRVAVTRRTFGAVAAAAAVSIHPLHSVLGDGARAATVELPRLRVPCSFIIDDSTCLVNMGHFCMPQFAAAWPQRAAYKKPWRQWPREIPDSFVREFARWCAQEGVKGKYSVVPYPACVGWLDRVLPGWSQKQLRDSLKLVRDELVPHWDIHPEMITHTRVIDLKTGRPMAAISDATMENSYPREKKSVDELAAYLAMALRILRNCDLPCEGITTPGGFGNLVKPELALAVHDAVRDVYGTELPHYFKYVAGPEESTIPRVENVDAAGGGISKAVVSVWAGTGDWFGGWDGDLEPQPDKYANRDATSGRMVELIERREPAVMLCHWPGLYGNGTLRGFRAFQRVVTSLHARFGDQLFWMKISELGRYYAVKQMAKLRAGTRSISIHTPFATRWFTVRATVGGSAPQVVHGGKRMTLTEVSRPASLDEGRYWKDGDQAVICFSLEQGITEIQW